MLSHLNLIRKITFSRGFSWLIAVLSLIYFGLKLCGACNLVQINLHILAYSAYISPKTSLVLD